MNAITAKYYESPFGTLLLGSHGEKLILCDWKEGRRRQSIDERLRKQFSAGFRWGTSDVIEKACSQLDEYFGHRLISFDLPLSFVGTDFQRRVWNELLGIPYGTTLSYGEVARRIGMPRAVRAVANACGANAISVIVPCHRVTGRDNLLTGYGGGLEVKRGLLTFEGVILDI